MRETLVIVSLDTEEDNWHRSRSGTTVENIAEVPALAAAFERWGVRATYFTSYHVAMERGAVETLREACAGGRAEIGAHLHPWNTPPLDEEFVPRNSMLKNLPADLQRAKLARLTRALEDGFGFTPRIFRAGRYGLGRETVAALVAQGYRVDSSVSPFINLQPVDDGPSFVGAPIHAYRLAPDREVTRPAPGGPLLEIPLSYGFNRGPFGFWGPARRLLESPPWRRLRLASVAARTGIVRRISLTPEDTGVRDLLILSRRLLEHGVRHLQLSFHTPTLKPGLSPFARTAADVARLYARIDQYLEGLSGLTRISFATISEAAAVLDGSPVSAGAAAW
ncbi:MAG TPA: hypothetical protein VFK78_02830 [Gemmatimonadales bacterium]|nr:hypothetical protein [Gemmatimonadales bacterium]